MNIVVTGGAGFIGSHLCDRLLKEGNRIFCVDNFSSGSKNNISHLLDSSHFTLIEHDIVEPLFIEEKIDQIYNLACPASPVYYQNIPIRTVEINVIGTLNMLGLAHKHGATLLQASTSEVYGDPKVHPQSETYLGSVNPTGPRACYDEGKRCAETLCFDYIRKRNLDVKVVRIFNTYGPRMAIDDGRVVSNFVVQALKGDVLHIDGDGSQTRSFCYVDDLLSGMVAMMGTSSDFHGPVNLGNPDEYTIDTFADKVIALTESQSTKEYTDNFRIDDPMQRCPDITLAKNELHWEPTISLEAGLSQTISYFKGVL
ncbi:MAG: SDR family oxidoreductase [Candidatus Magasanikbacteria bacterium]|nr:SDR family oxidoreductase [Candidatus Magasanikbacteria bacterium]MBT4221222.1 SDR family oxidoreductase [Candidatus Magasanikbacteria bacterium]MBT4350651.1 SDR family oxidoreductase [Candidatus Magasanikbacteria bacterium]MBT4541349.1 SDR family oxidoreductase [Candidatus Magasanikbacteria bacterium]MBT6253083.1 SDR family oxidoreductase [Candidatus Magasanikbacteria bacterium]